MRKITKTIKALLDQRKSWNAGGNTTGTYHEDGNYTDIRLHNNHVARHFHGTDVTHFSMAGWTSRTTQSRLNAIGVQVYQRAFEIYYHGTYIDPDKWYNTGDFVDARSGKPMDRPGETPYPDKDAVIPMRAVYAIERGALMGTLKMYHAVSGQLLSETTVNEASVTLWVATVDDLELDESYRDLETAIVARNFGAVLSYKPDVRKVFPWANPNNPGYTAGDRSRVDRFLNDVFEDMHLCVIECLPDQP